MPESLNPFEIALTQFEHALVFYHRGRRALTRNTDFKLGVQKCQEVFIIVFIFGCFPFFLNTEFGAL